jgi:putative DNA primase/helicase
VTPDPLLIPPPTSPLEVAHEFGRLHYADERARRLVYHRGLFYAWRGTRWDELHADAVRSRLWRWLGGASYLDENGVPVPFKPNRSRVANVLEALEAVAHLDERVEAPAWQTDEPWPAAETVAVENGLLHLPTRELHPHTPEFFNLHSLPFAFDPDAPEPECWHSFLRDLWGDDEESTLTLGEIMGYVLAGGTDLQKIFMLVGPKRTGKGTILRVLSALLGRENIAAPTLSSLATNFGLQPLVGKPLAAISDARLGTRADSLIAVERLLSISGEDAITVDRKYRDPWTGRLPTRFMLLTNEIPRFTDASGALASRFVILVLSNSFYGRENPRLTDELLTEASGIFNWCLASLDRLRERGRFRQPATAESAVRQIQDLASPVSAFVRDRCVVAADAEVEKDELWKTWRDWCDNEGAHPGTKAVFVRDLRAAIPGATPARVRVEKERRHVIRGLRLVGSDEDADDTEAAKTPECPGVPGVEPTLPLTQPTVFDHKRAARFDATYPPRSKV